MISATPPKHFHLFSPPSWLDSKSIFPVNQPKSSEWSLALYFQLSSGASPLPMLYPESRDHLLLLVFFRSLLSGLSASTYSLSYTEPSWPTKSKSIRLYHFFFSETIWWLIQFSHCKSQSNDSGQKSLHYLTWTSCFFWLGTFAPDIQINNQHHHLFQVPSQM